MWAVYKKMIAALMEAEEYVAAADEICLETEGSTCWYCFRIWNVHFAEQYTLTALKTELGKNHEMFETFQRYEKWLTKHLVDILKDNPQMSEDEVYITCWPSPDEIHEMDITEIKWTRPRDELLPLDSYKELKGCPESNGLGHKKETAPDGTILVNMGNNGKWSKTESIIFRAVKKRTARAAKRVIPRLSASAFRL